MENTFIEVGHYQYCKYNQHTEGDVFLSQKNVADGRVITTLSDGLGSGIKAGVLATLTATMATGFIAANIPIKRAAEIIMNTLPVCKERGISYATFTLVDIEPNNTVRIMEYDNPPYVLIRQETIVEPIKDIKKLERKYKVEADELPQVFEEYIAELDINENSEEEKARLKKELDKAEKQIAKASSALTNARRSAGTKLCARVTEELNELDMPGVRFEIKIEEKE